MANLVLPARHARRIAAKRARLDQQRPLPPALVQQLQDELRVLLTYHSNAIEGNTLDLSETALVIEHGITVGGHTLKEHLETVGHAEAITTLYAYVAAQAVLSHELVQQLQRVIMMQLRPDAGAYRTGPVTLRGSRHVSPLWQQVPELMDVWFHWLQHEGPAYDPIVRAALAHEAFLNIHPFFDGNGRTARLLLNLQLMQDDYPAILIQRGWRATYIRALEAAHFGDCQALLVLVGQAVEAGLDLWLDACERSMDDYRRPLREVAAELGLDPNYVGQLLRLQRIDGKQVGRRWYTSTAAVRRYQDEVVRGVNPPGRPPKA